ncbi:MAG: hypothetical protein DDT26_00588 [Dehalococcoidia bacterium]|nr:hypothetical protein [Chloroflexota bacterium]
MTGSYIGNQRPQHVKGSPIAHPFLNLNIGRDLVQRHVSRPFDHHLDTRLAGPVGQLSDGQKLFELRSIRSVGETSGTQPIAQAKGHIEFPGDLQQAVVLLVEGILAFMV